MLQRLLLVAADWQALLWCQLLQRHACMLIRSKLRRWHRLQPPAVLLQEARAHWSGCCSSGIYCC
jgi:hypothetical protein